MGGLILYGRGGYGAGGGVPYKIPSLGYYLSLLTSQYQLAPNLKQWLTVVAQLIVNSAVTVAELPNAFDIDSAIGPQLDMLGQIIGQGRIVSFQPTLGVSPKLDDKTYRILLKAKIAWNQWNGSIGSLYALWQQLFPGGRIAVQDNQDMTATIFLAGSFSSITQDLILNGLIVPRPQGVLYSYTFATLPVFGWDQITPFVSGWDQGHWS